MVALPTWGEYLLEGPAPSAARYSPLSSLLQAGTHPPTAQSEECEDGMPPESIQARRDHLPVLKRQVNTWADQGKCWLDQIESEKNWEKLRKVENPAPPTPPSP